MPFWLNCFARTLFYPGHFFGIWFLDSRAATKKVFCTQIPIACFRIFCSGLQGVIHRDLKPEQILLSNRMELRLSDFNFGELCLQTSQPMNPGTASSSSKSVDETKEPPHKLGAVKRRRRAALVGTVQYMAPEVYRSAICMRRKPFVFFTWLFLFPPLAGKDCGQCGKSEKKCLKKILITIWWQQMFGVAVSFYSLCSLLEIPFQRRSRLEQIHGSSPYPFTFFGLICNAR